MIKVEDHYIPADFIVLETGKCMDESIILGRPFLATAKAVIDVDREELVLQLKRTTLYLRLKVLLL